MNIQSIFGQPERETIQQAIADSERKTSGELRIHIESKTKLKSFDRALQVFEKLNMHKTEQRNGVLIYLAYENRQFSIVADQGINEKVPEGFWNSVTDVMSAYFKEGKFTEGLVHGIHACGEKLALYFPYDNKNDKNELSDEISFGE